LRWPKVFVHGRSIAAGGMREHPPDRVSDHRGHRNERVA
jgi:hypothetical protein